MAPPTSCAAALARLVFLLRDSPDQRKELQAAFTDLIASVGTEGHAFLAPADAFLLDGNGLDLAQPTLGALHAQLRAHGLGTVLLPPNIPPADLHGFVRLLAAAPGKVASAEHFRAQLAGHGIRSIQVAAPASDRVEGLMSGEVDRTAVRPHRPDPATSVTDDTARLTGLGKDVVSESEYGMMHFATLDSKAIGDLGSMTGDLGRKAGGTAESEFLNKMIAAGEEAARRGAWGEVLKAAAVLVRHEDDQPDGADRRGFGLALRRLVPRAVLEQLARLTVATATRQDAILVLRRMGADSTEILLELLIAAEGAGERRAYFNALTHMTEGTQLLVHMLTHDEWFVVRNVAELCGEMKLEEAVLPLAKKIGHEDERVRRAVAGALARIGTPGTVEPLRQALLDSSPQVRRMAVAGIDGRRGRSLVPAMIRRLDEETVGDVQREILAALGRVGSPEALQALARAAEPGGRLLKRKPAAYRLAAVQGLHAAGPSAANHLKKLLDDVDEEIQGAARKALANLW
jgi:HEAT repeat protein/PBS lyase HEAT-like repeat-containing protein